MQSSYARVSSQRSALQYVTLHSTQNLTLELLIDASMPFSMPGQILLVEQGRADPLALAPRQSAQR